MKRTVAFKSQWQVLWQRNLTADVIKSAVPHLQPAETFTATEDTHRHQCLHTGKQRHALSVTERVMCSDDPVTAYSVLFIRTCYCCISVAQDSQLIHIYPHTNLDSELDVITNNYFQCQWIWQLYSWFTDESFGLLGSSEICPSQYPGTYFAKTSIQNPDSFNFKQYETQKSSPCSHFRRRDKHFFSSVYFLH